MKITTRAFLLVGLVFLIGAVFGGLLTLRLARRAHSFRMMEPGPPGGAFFEPGPPPGEGDGPFSPPRPGEGPPGPGGPPRGDRENVMLSRMIRQLDLDPDQQSRVREILQESRREQMQIMETHGRELRESRHKTLEAIRAVLRPEQEREMGRMLRRLRRQGRERLGSGRP